MSSNGVADMRVSTERELQDESRDHFHRLLGPLRQYFDNERVTNVEVNEDEGADTAGGEPGGRIFVEEFGRAKYEAPERMARRQRQALVAYLANLEQGRAVDRLHSRLACDLPHYDARVQAFAPPVSDWPIIFRFHAKQVITLDQYRDANIITPNQREFFREAIRERLNIAIVGEMDSGKTTLTNAFIEEIRTECPSHRLIILQDRHELKSLARNKLFLFAGGDQAYHSSNGHENRYTYELHLTIEDALRTNGNRLILGEIRQALAARALMVALNSGSRGAVWTCHANSAEDGPAKIEDLIELAGGKAKPRFIARFIDVVVHIAKIDNAGNRKVTEVGRITGVKKKRYQVEYVA